MEQRKEILQKMNMCRFCFNNNEEELTNIYQKEPKSVPLPIQIMSCVSIEVFANDGFPPLICNTCKQQTNQSYVFRTNCRKADDALKNFLLSGEIPKPLLTKPKTGNVQKNSSPILPIKDVKVVAKRVASDDPFNVKRTKLNDGTEIITLCISQTQGVDVPSQEISETSQDQCKSVEPPNSEDEIEDVFEESVQYKRPEVKQVQTDVFPCKYCEKTFPLEQLLDLHFTTHHRERNFACNKCDTKFFTKYDLTKHQQTHSNEKGYRCVVCQKQFSREPLLRRHERTHIDAPQYMCAECEQTFLDKDHLENHMRKHEKNKPFTCETCKKSFVFKQGLERHIKSVHSEQRPYNCNYCEASFTTPIRLARHITTHAGLRPYPCKICSRTFLLSHHLTRHMRSHYEKQPEAVIGQHKCDVCSMSFRRKDSLINHSAIHSMVNLKCVICNTSFDNAKMVKDHITTHLQGLPFPCEKCDYSFETEGQLIEHEVKHAEMEYEEQIEKEVFYEAGWRIDNPASSEEDEENLEQNRYENTELVDQFSITDFEDPSSLVPVTNSQTSDASPRVHMQTVEQDQNKKEQEDILTNFFKTEAASADEEDPESNQIATDSQEEEKIDTGIRPIFRIEGTKMYQRKGPIKRKLPTVQRQAAQALTAPLEEINEPPNMRGIKSEALSNLPAKEAVNVKMGDKVVKVQKFIISKEEMKNMAKLGILEVKNGKVIMKTPGQPILNAKIKPVQQSDIDSLLQSQKNLSKPGKKQYERKLSFSSQRDTSTDNGIEDYQ